MTQWQTDRCFNHTELDKVAQAAHNSEELVNNYYKLSTSQWLKDRYDIKTAKDLAGHELLDGPFAQVIKYQGRKRGAALGSSLFSYYKVCLQDRAILFASEDKSFELEPFLLYILTHELVHVVRFSTFEHRYESKNESEMTWEEESKVHSLTFSILSSVSIPGMEQVLEFYRNWIHPHPGLSA